MLKGVTHFISSNSTVTACFEKSLSVDKDMHNLIDNKTYSGGFFCDLLRACNCVTHDILVLPFIVYGIQRHSWAVVGIIGSLTINMKK
jgi:hypothetical protein